MKVNRNLTTILTALVFLGFLSAGFAFAGNHKFDSELKADLDGIEKVTIEVKNGSIEIETWKKDNVEIEILERVSRSDRKKAKRIAEEAELTSRRQGSTLIIEVDYGDLSRKDRDKYSCSVDVRLPEHLEISLRTTNGSISSDRMDDDVTAHTTNGSIDLDGCGGDAEVVTTNGAIRVGSVLGHLDVRTTNGSLRLAGAGGDIHARTTNGGISLDVDPESSFIVEVETTNGRIVENLSHRRFEGRLNRRRTHLVGTYGEGDIDRKISLKTTNGKVSIDEA